MSYIVIQSLPVRQQKSQPLVFVKQVPHSVTHFTPSESEKDAYEINLDVQQFSPEEITVKVSGEKEIIIEAKHEEKEDEHGSIYRHFVRRYIIPDEYDINNVNTKLSLDGVLKVICPKKVVPKSKVEKTVPIVETGVPFKPIKEKEG